VVAAESSSPGLPAGSGTNVRFAFVDLLRGISLVVMVETHVVNSYLLPALRLNWSFTWLSFINGLVAPTFLFASGFSVILQGRRQWDAWLRFGAPFWRQMRRLGFITLVAYYSHLQHFKLTKYLHPDEPDIWKNSLQVDILQCIVFSLLVVHLLILLLRKPRAVAWGGLFLGVVIAILTPWLWSRDFTGSLPLPIALFLNPHGVSLFPIFPWMFFPLCGAFASQQFLVAVQEGREDRIMRRFFAVGIVLIVAGLAGTFAPYSLPGYNDFFTTSPLYLLIRLGCVLIFCPALYALEKYLRWVPERLRLAGQESLLVYGVHLWVIFAFLRGKHVGPLIGLEKGYLGCFVLSAAIILLMLWLARFWHHLKTEWRRPVKSAQFATVVFMMAVFLLR